MAMRRWLAALGALLSMLAVAACGGGGADGADTKDTKLRAAWTVGAKTLDPHMQSSEIVGDRFGLFSLYDRLFTVKADGSIGPMLATKWSYGEDGETLRIKLREDATFHDGTVLDADVVKANLDRARTLDSPVVKGRMSVVESVEVTGKFSVTLSLSENTSVVPYALAEASGMMMNPKLIKDGDPAKKADGTTPYSVESFDPGRKLVLVRDRDDYWDPKAWKIKRIEHSQISDFNAMSNAMRAGQIDVGQFQPNQVSSLEGVPGLEIVKVPQGQGFDIALNYDVPPLNDIRVRQAVNNALDRQAIVKVFYPGSVPKYQYYREGTPGYDPALEGAYAHDPAKAKELLASAGFPNGVDLGTMLVDTSNLPGVLDVVKEQLGAAGITFEARVIEPLQSFERWAQGKDAARILSVTMGTSPVIGAQENWRTGTRNAAKTTPEFERLFEAAAKIGLSRDEADATARKLNAYVVEQAWRAPIVWQNPAYVLSDKIKGFSADLDFATTQGPYDWRYLTTTG